MSDFTIAAISRLIPLGLARQGIQLDTPKTTSSKHIAISDKRHILHLISSQYGDEALVRLGEGVMDAPDEPALSALTMATSPHDLFNRWQRMERFAHSKNRTEITVIDDKTATLHHQSRDPDDAPTREEDLLVFGILIGLLTKIECLELTARFHGEVSWRFKNTKWSNTSWPHNVSTWELGWRTFKTSDAVAKTSINTVIDHNQDWALLAKRALDLDPGRGWTVNLLASELQTTSRTLQRKLANQQTHFTQLLSQVRSGHAARLLANTCQSAAEIGYACGYADQTHFNREFKRYSAVTPLQYRKQFGTGNTEVNSEAMQLNGNLHQAR